MFIQLLVTIEVINLILVCAIIEQIFGITKISSFSIFEYRTVLIIYRYEL